MHMKKLSINMNINTYKQRYIWCLHLVEYMEYAPEYGID